MSCCCNFTE